MPRKDLTIAEKIVVLRKISEQSPNSSHLQLAEITGVPRHLANQKQSSILMD